MRVFVSYRRSDSKDIAARIADNLAMEPQIDDIFLDVDSIAHGEVFPDRLNSEIARADVILAVIGPRWQGAIADNDQPRIFSEKDFVRREIETALQSNKRVIPCLVDDAVMPGADDLPPSIAALAERNAITLRHTSFRVDLDILSDSILKRERVSRRSRGRVAMGAAWRFASGIALAALVAIAIAWTGVRTLQMPLETILGGRIMLSIFLLVLFVAFQFATYRFVRRFI